MRLLSIIVPCHCNKFNIPVTGLVLVANEARFPIAVTFEYVLVDDGARYTTWAGLPILRHPVPAVGASHRTLSKKVKLFVGSLLSFSPVRAIPVLGLGGCALLYGLFLLTLRLTGPRYS